MLEMYRNYISILTGKDKHHVQKKLDTEMKLTRNKKAMIQSEFVTVNGVPIRVDSWGGYLPSKILAQTQEKPKDLILMIPGNPGVTKFYETFLSCLHERTKKPIWIISHGGHDNINKKMPSLKENRGLYDLQGQIEQKNAFIETYLDGVVLYCIGHSIGCKMILELLKKERKSQTEIEKCLMLFPTLERMAETNNGANVIFVIKYILWLTLLGSWIFVYLPRFLQWMLLRIYCMVTRVPPHNMSAMLRLVDPHVLNKVFFLANDEMIKVKELDDETIKLHGDKLKLYYGESDGWTPIKYFREMREKHKNVSADVCSYNHTFVLSESKEVADLACLWLKS
ncbi:hypothetical protein RUM43_004850 [Polyplax serrata]|uniref:Lipid droplet-associated hydrolase n=1 Tax=Polyplax serrata TaxID=468196 RepID=A0AAN8XMK6_POLSC